MLDKQTWPDGTPKSAGPFAWRKEPAIAANEAVRQKNLARYESKLAKEGRTRSDIAKQKATRVNPEASLAAFIPNSRKAPR